MQGGNDPIVTIDGERIVDSHGRVSVVTTAGNGPSLRQVPAAWVTCPPTWPRSATRFKVMYMNELFPVTVVATSGSAFDPDDTRLKS